MDSPGFERGNALRCPLGPASPSSSDNEDLMQLLQVRLIVLAVRLLSICTAVSARVGRRTYRHWYRLATSFAETGRKTPPSRLPSAQETSTEGEVGSPGGSGRQSAGCAGSDSAEVGSEDEELLAQALLAEFVGCAAARFASAGM